MEYQKIINLLDNKSNRPSKYKTKNCVKIIDEPQETYNEDNQIRLKTSMLTSNLRNYSNAYILVKGTITVANTAAQGQLDNAINKKVRFKHLVPFVNSISRINNTQVDNTHEINVVMPMYNLLHIVIFIQKHL